MQLHVQLPLVAKAYEVEGLRQAMAGLRSDLNTQLQQALAGEGRSGGTSSGEQAMEVMLALDRHFTAQQAHAAALSQRLGCLEVGCGLAEARSKAAEALAAGLESSLQSALSELRLEKVPRLCLDIA
ncbi:hypothetical protein HaLaN_00168 [Haematococcus lacustris]|uniref:Uncharacterized protein n=1 Tax=Haematococcus lacustris TaxID=44745 RepID=A0A699YIA2_HAELA|nr:hypothetical protein HaLaN_00168 [Haematococcus lacustris]